VSRTATPSPLAQTPPVLTGDRATDRALFSLARLLADIARGSTSANHAPLATEHQGATATPVTV
jgi:hypothetical protein